MWPVKKAEWFKCLHKKKTCVCMLLFLTSTWVFLGAIFLTVIERFTGTLGTLKKKNRTDLSVRSEALSVGLHRAKFSHTVFTNIYHISPTPMAISHLSFGREVFFIRGQSRGSPAWWADSVRLYNIKHGISSKRTRVDVGQGTHR